MQKSVTLIFPGQGSQYVGMGKHLEEARDLFSTADKVLDYHLSKICFEGPEEDLKLTENTQPAILTHSIALFLKVKKFLDNNKIKIDRVLGHSVGEYAALVAAGAIDFRDAVKAVHLRGRYMQKAVPAGIGKMIAILKMPEELIVHACQAASTEGSIVAPANFNGPNQIVISGHADACDRAVQWLKENTDKRVKAMELKVSAPFHSQLMKPAADKLATQLNNISFNKLQIPYIANIDATEYGSNCQPDEIRSRLIGQVYSTVQWTRSIEQLPAGTLAIEVGPGKILAGMVKKIDPEIQTISIDIEDGMEQLQKHFAS